MWDTLCDVLTDFDYLQARIGAISQPPNTQPPSLVFDLLDDFQNTLAALPADHLMRRQLGGLQAAIRQNQYVLYDDPSLLVQQVFN